MRFRSEGENSEKKVDLLDVFRNHDTGNPHSSADSFYKMSFKNELKILQSIQSEFTPGIVKYYSNISKFQSKTFQKFEAWRKNKIVGPRICYYMMSRMQEEHSWGIHVEYPRNQRLSHLKSTPLTNGRLKTGIFDVKAHLTVQLLKALQSFGSVENQTVTCNVVKNGVHPRYVCHSDLHIDSVQVSVGENVYITLSDIPFPEKDINFEYIEKIKVVVNNFGHGIIVKNRFETYKDYFDLENLLKYLWYGDLWDRPSIPWNDSVKEFEWLISQKEGMDYENCLLDTQDNIGSVEKVRILQTLLSDFTKIKNGMQRLYEKNCQSQQFRAVRGEISQKKSRRMSDDERVYYQDPGPCCLKIGEQLKSMVAEHKLAGYELRGVLNSDQLSFMHVGDIVEVYRTAIEDLQKRI